MDDKKIIIDDNSNIAIDEVRGLPWVFEDGTWDDTKYWRDDKIMDFNE